MLLYLEIALLLILIVTVPLIVIYSLKLGISPTPSSPAAQAAILQLIPEEQTGVILELGSGWGSLIFPIARRCPNARVIGIEGSPIPFLFSKVRQILFPRENLSIRYENFYDISFREASVVVCYLFPAAMKQLRFKFEEELPAESLVISHTFAIYQWQPIKIIKLSDIYRTPIYLYKVPSKA